MALKTTHDSVCGPPNPHKIELRNIWLDINDCTVERTLPVDQLLNLIQIHRTQKKFKGEIKETEKNLTTKLRFWW
mgnify:CR=1 FL=1